MQSISPVRLADLIGGTSLPAIAGIIYGAIFFFEYSNLGHTVSAILFLGGIASLICIQAAVWVFFSSPGRSWGKAVAAFSIFVPYLYSLFLMGYLGLWELWRCIFGYHGVLPIFGAVFWLLAGWRMLYVLGKISRKETS